MSHDGRLSPERAAVDRLIAAGRVEEALKALIRAAVALNQSSRAKKKA